MTIAVPNTTSKPLSGATDLADSYAVEHDHDDPSRFNFEGIFTHDLEIEFCDDDDLDLTL